MEDKIAARKLKALLKISNIYVGDAIANLLMIEAVLRDLDYSVEQFSQIYEEYPSKMFKAVVEDRTSFKTIWDETRLEDPIALQRTLDQLVKQVEGGRAFVRPSGTEDILRLYVETKNKEDIQKLADKILGEID